MRQKLLDTTAFPISIMKTTTLFLFALILWINPVQAADTDQIARDLAWLCFEGTTVERLGKLYKSANSLPDGDSMKVHIHYVVAAGLLNLGEYDRFLKLPKTIQNLDPLLELHGICGECNGTGYRSGSCKRCEKSGKCPVCRGRGNERHETLKGTFIDIPCKACGKTGKCSACNGRGSWAGPCPLCEGTGEGPAVGFSKFYYRITLAYLLLDYYERSSYATDMVAQKKVYDYLRSPGIKESDFCFSCGRMLYGSPSGTANTKYGKKTFCSSCFSIIQQHRACFACSRKGSFEVEPDIYLCKKCSRRRVVGESFGVVLDDVCKQVNDILGGKIDLSTTQVLIVDFQSLQNDSNPDSIVYGEYMPNHTLDKTTKTIVKKNDAFVIRISRNLPIDILRDVLAHELGHHWLHQNVLMSRSKKEEEGFAEWLASLVDKHYEAYMLYWAKEWSPDPIYGEGYRIMKERINDAPNASWAYYFQDER